MSSFQMPPRISNEGWVWRVPGAPTAMPTRKMACQMPPATRVKCVGIKKTIGGTWNEAAGFSSMVKTKHRGHDKNSAALGISKYFLLRGLFSTSCFAELLAGPALSLVPNHFTG